MDQQTVVAGAPGGLSTRIAAAPVDRGAAVRALVRPTTDPAARERLARAGAAPVEVDPADLGALTAACEGEVCVVSAMSALRDVVVDAQSVLVDAAVAAGVPRFVPSDHSCDLTTTQPGHHRNLDLRRGLAEVASEVSGTPHRTLRAGGVRSLSALTAVARTLAPTEPEPVFPAWQGMAYLVDVFSGDAQLDPLDVDRYPGLTWTDARERLDEVLAPTIPTA